MISTIALPFGGSTPLCLARGEWALNSLRHDDSHSIRQRVVETMSDLAPFVAAALRDKVVLDLHDENKKLVEEIEELKHSTRVRFTGPNSIPNYAAGSIKDATTSVHDEGGGAETLRKRVPVSNFDEIPRPATSLDLKNTELWVGDRRIGVLSDTLADKSVDLQQHDGKNYLEFRFLFWEHEFTYVETSFEVGPFTDDEAQVELRNCEVSHDNIWNPLSGLERVPGVTFKSVDLYEPNNAQALA